MNESSHTWMSHVTYEWVMSHTNKSRDICMNHVTSESCHRWVGRVTYKWVTAQKYLWHDSFVSRLLDVCDMHHSYVWHDSFICVTWLIHMCDMTHSYVWHDSFICVTWLIHMFDICVLRLVHICDMTRPHVWHDAFICVTWIIQIRVLTQASFHSRRRSDLKYLDLQIRQFSCHSFEWRGPPLTSL